MNYVEIIATRSLDVAKAETFVTNRRIAERRNMAARTEKIEAGLRHLTPAMEDDMRGKGEL